MSPQLSVFPDVLQLDLTYSPLHADLNSLWCFFFFNAVSWHLELISFTLKWLMNQITDLSFVSAWKHCKDLVLLWSNWTKGKQLNLFLFALVQTADDKTAQRGLTVAKCCFYWRASNEADVTVKTAFLKLCFPYLKCEAVLFSDFPLWRFF